uniref:Uncharacterized protein n=1 Tax=Knipowitschia caucasica TaxID=637954 RepID=A0AAV2LSJ8_KNICA
MSMSKARTTDLRCQHKPCLAHSQREEIPVLLGTSHRCLFDHHFQEQGILVPLLCLFHMPLTHPSLHIRRDTSHSHLQVSRLLHLLVIQAVVFILVQCHILLQTLVIILGLGQILDHPQVHLLVIILDLVHILLHFLAAFLVNSLVNIMAHPLVNNLVNILAHPLVNNQVHFLDH